MLNRGAFVLIFFTLIAAARAGDFLIGGDLSLLRAEETAGVMFKDGEKLVDVLTLFKERGGTCVRLRLFVNPDGKAGVVNDLPYTIALARRVKAAGLILLLDLHYSDTWADPGSQTTPAAWKALSFEALKAQVERYTSDTIRAFRAAGVMPRYLQIGNEITHGMLWPTARFDKAVEPDAAVFNRLCGLLAAGVRGAKSGAGEDAGELKIVLHTHGGADKNLTTWFFDNVTRRDVPFDVIGVSFYPERGFALEELKTTITYAARRYGKPVLVAETAAAWRDSDAWRAKSLPWPATPAGQKAFLADVSAAVRGLPEGRGLGVIWWYPEAVPAKSAQLPDYHGGDWALFDDAGRALPALDALGER